MGDLMDDSFAPPPPSDSFAPPDAFGAPADEFVPPPAADSYTAAPADPYSPPPAEMDGGMGGMGFGAPDAGMGMPAPQSSAMDEFTRKWEAEIQAKDDEEQEAKKLAVVKARGELEKAESERLVLRDSNMAKNRSEEQVWARSERAARARSTATTASLLLTHAPVLRASRPRSCSWNRSRPIWRRRTRGRA